MPNFISLSGSVLKINRFLYSSVTNAVGHLKLSESFKSVAQGVPEIFEEVYLGGGGGDGQLFSLMPSALYFVFL